MSTSKTSALGEFIRFLGSKAVGFVEIALPFRACVEISDNFQAYGKLQVSDEFNTIAYGKIIELIE